MIGGNVNLAEFALLIVGYKPSRIDPPVSPLQERMSDGADAAVTTVVREPRWPARTFGALSIAFGGGSFLALPEPVASAFPWVTLALSLAGAVMGIAAIRQRPRGRLAVGLAMAGLLLSLAIPLLVVIVFARYFNWKG